MEKFKHVNISLWKPQVFAKLSKWKSCSFVKHLYSKTLYTFAVISALKTLESFSPFYPFIIHSNPSFFSLRLEEKKTKKV